MNEIQATLKFTFKYYSVEKLAELVVQIKQEIALTERRIERLKHTQERKPNWTAYDAYADAEIGIDIRIEEQQMVLDYDEEVVLSIEKELDWRRGLNQTIPMFKQGGLL